MKVRNLNNCIKIAEDFVSPELTNNCLQLTQVPPNSLRAQFC